MQKLSEQSAQTRAEPMAVAHFGEPLANEVRRRLAAIEPRSLRTLTPTQAVFEKSEGSYHFTPEGRKLADFTSGVLVANLGHNPIRWWQRLLCHMKLDRMPTEGSFFTAVPLTTYKEYPVEEMRSRARAFRDELRRRRTIREFSDRPVELEIIQDCIAAAGTAPNGANHQPWHFVVVSDPEVKKRIRMEAEEEEQAFYAGRASNEWLEALQHLGTDQHKPFLERAPYLIVIMAESYGVLDDGTRRKNYYVQESVGIATGMLISAVHNAGLASLTHTPSPMGFLNEILGRPKNERPFLILVVGFPEDGVTVPDIDKKPVEEVTSFV